MSGNVKAGDWKAGCEVGEYLPPLDTSEIFTSVIPNGAPCRGPWPSSEQVCAEHSPICAGLDSGAKAPHLSAILTAEAGKLFVELPQPKLGEVTTSHSIAQYRLNPLYLRNAFGHLSSWYFRKISSGGHCWLLTNAKHWGMGEDFKKLFTRICYRSSKQGE